MRNHIVEVLRKVIVHIVFSVRVLISMRRNDCTLAAAYTPKDRQSKYPSPYKVLRPPTMLTYIIHHVANILCPAFYSNTLFSVSS